MITGRRELAEDAVQQAFVRVLARGRGDVRSEDAFLRRMVRNEAYRLLSRRREDRPLEEGEVLVSAQDGPADAEERQRLNEAVRRLTPEQRELVHLKVYEQMTFAAIGELLGIPMNTAASRYRYALENLRQMMVERSHERR